MEWTSFYKRKVKPEVVTIRSLGRILISTVAYNSFK
jgi:hypothetical protein